MPDNAVSLVVVDCQYDFINGTLGCQCAEAAVMNAVLFINNHPDMHVMYSMDWHPANHSSFAKYGGIWPEHCVQNTKGSRLHDAFAGLVQNPEQRPNARSTYHKGMHADVEEYSAFNARCEATGHAVSQDALHDVVICGLASEYCVRETAAAMMKSGRRVALLTDAIGWINSAQHSEIMKYLISNGASVLRTHN